MSQTERLIDGDLVRARRETLGLSQNSLAHEVGTSQNYMCRLENVGGTDCSIAFALRLAEALKCRVEDLVTDYAAE